MLQLLGAALFEVGRSLTTVGGVVNQQMVGDVQNMTADQGGGILAACADDYAAVDERQRGIAGCSRPRGRTRPGWSQPAIALAGLSAAAFAWRSRYSGAIPTDWPVPRKQLMSVPTSYMMPRRRGA